MIEASLQVGKGVRSSTKPNENSGQSQEGQPAARMTKDTSASGPVKNDNKTSQAHINDNNDATINKKGSQDTNNLYASLMTTGPGGKGSLMQRMANPATQTAKKVGGSTFGNTMMTTMAATGGKNAGDVSINSS